MIFLFVMTQALPIFLDDMFNEVVAVLLSVTFVLAFGEVHSLSILPTFLRIVVCFWVHFERIFISKAGTFSCVFFVCVF